MNEALTKYLLKEKIGIKELSVKVGLSQTTVKRHVYGERKISSELLIKYSDATKIPIRELLSNLKKDWNPKNEILS